MCGAHCFSGSSADSLPGLGFVGFGRVLEIPTLAFLVTSSGRRDLNPIDLHGLLLDGRKESHVDHATLGGKRYAQFLPVSTANKERRALAS